MVNKKKKKKHAGGASQWDLNQDVEEELLALESIYADAFEVDEDRHGFTCMIVPHPGQGEENHCSAEMHVR